MRKDMFGEVINDNDIVMVVTDEYNAHAGFKNGALLIASGEGRS